MSDSTSRELPHLPILRFGKAYKSLDKELIVDPVNQEPLAEVSRANAGILRRDLRKVSECRKLLRKLPFSEMLKICKKAGELFVHGRLPMNEEGFEQGPEEYVEILSRTSGLTHVMCRNNMQKVFTVFDQMDTILKGLTRNLDLSILDRGWGEQHGVPLSYGVSTDSVGVILPSNSPGVNSIWMPAIALKVPVVLKPGREEPWTPLRIAQAFRAAGCPAEAFGFYPTDHEGAATVLQTCGRALLFGDEKTTAPYAENPAVEVHGPGRSKILIGEDQINRWEEFLDVLVTSVVANGGRSCVNASAIFVPSKGREIAQALAQRLLQHRPLPPEDPQATLSSFANPKFAEFINQSIDQGLQQPGATDVTLTSRGEPRKVVAGGRTYLLPTVVQCDSVDHPLANTEYLFPFVSVVEVPHASFLHAIGPSLVVTAITQDEALRQACVESPHIDRLNLGPAPTTRVDWDQPHEGNLFEFLYSRNAIHRVSDW